MGNPLYARGKPVNQLLVEDPDVVRGDIVPVDADDAVVLASRLEASEELGAVFRVHDLQRKLRQQQP